MANITPGETDKHKKIIIKIKDDKKASEVNTNTDAPEVVLLTIGGINGKKAQFTSPKTRNEAKYLITELSKLNTLMFDEENILEPIGIVFTVKKNNVLETGEKLE